MNDNDHFDHNDVPDVGDVGDLHGSHGQENVKYEREPPHPHQEKHHEETTPSSELRARQEEGEDPQQQGNNASSKPEPPEDEDEDHDDILLSQSLDEPIDEKMEADLEIIKTTAPSTSLELALTEMLKRKETHISRLTSEVQKLKKFISKRKQTYKRKRKDEGAPTRALSAYNIFVQDRFAQLAKENEKALKSTDSDAQLKRVPPANLVASTGNHWKELPAEEKAKYEERAKTDRKRYEDQMAQYQPPDKQANRKRNKTGYNMFFSAHVLRLKQSETGVPSERGSVARLVGNAWKQLSQEEKNYYEREADKHNGMNPVKDDVDDEDDDEKRHHHLHMGDPYAHMHPHPGMHMHGIPPEMHGHQPPHHDPRHHYAPYPHHMYGQNPYGYDYTQHQPQQHHQSSRNSQSRSHSSYNQGYGPPGRHGYDNL